ncbi:MAG TPA: GntR family transcriptional regulator, partial [Reyranella sp.]|nr:GntR family transcriptional regulator [Reyranella sp.]
MSTAPSFAAMAPSVRLSERVAEALAAEIRSGRLQPGNKLPTEPELVAQFAVSRTVVREAVSRLKSIGLVESRQGSGVYVLEAAIPPLSFDANEAVSREAVIQMVEVRRALEAEVAGLAAQRRSPEDLQRIRQAVA